MLILISEEEKTVFLIYLAIYCIVYISHTGETGYKYSYLYKTFLRGLKSICVGPHLI